uniref:Transposase n=1 Tax=Macrostomum lignano TaxID=282301 RepID=A0A1I8GBL0_9PLAT
QPQTPPPHAVSQADPGYPSPRVFKADPRTAEQTGLRRWGPIQWLLPNLGMRVWLASPQAVDRPALLADPNRLIATVAKEGPAGSAGRSDQSYQTQNTQRPASSAGGSKGTASSEPKRLAKSGRSDEAQRAPLERKRAKQTRQAA